MKRLTLLPVLWLVAACTEQPGTAPAAKTYEEIVANSGCLSCHQVNNQMKLPTWSQVSARYKGNKEAETLLMNKIARGGSGSWGKMDMPPYHPDLSEEERRVLVRGILATPVASQQ